MAKVSMSALEKRYPWTTTPLIIGAPMKAISGVPLALAISEAGGFGFIGPGDAPSDLQWHLDIAESLLSESEALSSEKLGVLPIGFGVQTWTGDLAVTRKILIKWNERGKAPAAAWLFAPRNGQTELDEWSREIRATSPGTEIWIQVASVADAIDAAKSTEKPNVLVLQGTDAGGHSKTQGAGIVSLLPEVADALNALPGDSIPLIAAGGLSDSRGVAASLTLGASGAALGTRFLASLEAQIHPGYQKAVLDGWDGGQNTVRTQVYNHLRGTMGWPKEFDARGLINQSWRDHLAGMKLEENQKLYKAAFEKGADGWGKQEGRLATYAGTGVGLVREVQSAGDVVREVRDGVRGILGGVVKALEKSEKL